MGLNYNAGPLMMRNEQARNRPADGALVVNEIENL